MNCREAQNLLFDYAEGDLPLHVERAFHRHLTSCSSCTREAEGYIRTIELTRDSHCESGGFSELPNEIVYAVLGIVDGH